MMKVLCTRATHCESGATAIEHGLIAALMSVALLTGADTLGDTVAGQFMSLTKKLDVASQEPRRSGGGTSMISLQPQTVAQSFGAINPPPPLP